MTKHTLLRLAAVAAVSAMALQASGCSPEWKKKFIRKSKEPKQIQPILVLESDERATYPPSIRYQEHFAYWKSWHSELLASLGQLKKRDERYLNGAIGELRSLQALLSGPQQDRMRQILVELGDIAESWDKMGDAAWRPPVADRTRLEKIQREVNKKFHYSKVKQAVAKDAAQPEASVADAQGK